MSNQSRFVELKMDCALPEELQYEIERYVKYLNVLTRNRVDNADGIRRIPYYRFIFDHSEGRGLVENIKKMKDGQHQKE